MIFASRIQQGRCQKRSGDVALGEEVALKRVHEFPRTLNSNGKLKWSTPECKQTL